MPMLLSLKEHFFMRYNRLPTEEELKDLEKRWKQSGTLFRFLKFIKGLLVWKKNAN